MKITKKIILQSILFLWVIFSVVYIINNEWSSYKKVQLVNAYNQGKIDTVNAVVEEANKCLPFTVFGEVAEVNLVKVDCLELEVE